VNPSRAVSGFRERLPAYPNPRRYESLRVVRSGEWQQDDGSHGICQRHKEIELQNLYRVYGYDRTVKAVQELARIKAGFGSKAVVVLAQ